MRIWTPGGTYIWQHNMDREVIPAEEIANKLSIPKEFVSKILQSLTESGIVNSRKGKSGGFAIAKDPKRIKLN